MMIRAKAPLRVSLAGGGTDVPPFPVMEGGAVLSTTINSYAWGTLRPRDDREIRINSLDFGVSLTYGSHADLVLDGQLDLVKATIKQLIGSESLWARCSRQPRARVPGVFATCRLRLSPGLRRLSRLARGGHSPVRIASGARFKHQPFLRSLDRIVTLRSPVIATLPGYVLAGGLGLRLRSVIGPLPKTLAPEGLPMGVDVSLEQDVFPGLIGRRASSGLRAVVFDRFFVDIGIPRDHAALDRNPEPLLCRPSAC